MEVSLNDLGNQGSPSGYDPIPTHAIIIDASTFNFIDTQGVNTLLQVGNCCGGCCSIVVTWKNERSIVCLMRWEVVVSAFVTLGAIVPRPISTKVIW